MAKQPAMGQQSHPALLIPGPIELDDDVARSMSHYAESHVGAPFCNIFGETLAMLRKLFQTTSAKSQPLVVAGSGTLGWDMVAANIVEPGDDVLVLHTGYFADSFADCFASYGVKATQLKAPIGDRPQLPEIEKALQEKKYKALTVTHVDTSTGVLSELQPISDLLARVSPSTLLIVDGVCSIGSEELHFDNMRIDVVLTASQKAIGSAPGLSILMCSGRAISAYQTRTLPPGSYYASFKNWLPIMQNYEAKKPSYFATPPTQLIHALHTSLTQLLSRSSLPARFAAHHAVSQRVKSAITNDLGLQQLAVRPENQANGMTAMYLPEGLTPPDILPLLTKRGVIFAGGLHREIATRYIRFGHMGVSAVDDEEVASKSGQASKTGQTRGEIGRALDALKEALAEAKKAKGL